MFKYEFHKQAILDLWSECSSFFPFSFFLQNSHNIPQQRTIFRTKIIKKNPRNVGLIEGIKSNIVFPSELSFLTALGINEKYF